MLQSCNDTPPRFIDVHQKKLLMYINGFGAEEKAKMKLSGKSLNIVMF